MRARVSSLFAGAAAGGASAALLCSAFAGARARTVAVGGLLVLVALGALAARIMCRRVARDGSLARAGVAALADVTDATPVGITQFAPDGTILYANPSGLALAGRTSIEDGMRIQDLIHCEDLDAATEAMLGAAATGADYDVVLRLVRPDGTTPWVRSIGRPVVDGEGNLMRVVVSSFDVTEWREAQAENARFAALLDGTSDVVVMARPSGEVVFANQVASNFLVGRSDAEAGGPSYEALFSADGRLRLRDEAMPELLHSGAWVGELDVDLGAGHVLPVSVAMQAHRDARGDVEFMSLIARDVSELKAAQAALAERATRDALTGLPNRSLLDEHLANAISRLRRSGGMIGVLFCDLDGFKAVNDTLGHDAGDALLVEVAKRLQSAVRDHDVVARIGGDEFVVLLDGIATAADAARVAERIVEVVDAPFALEQGDARVGVSAGVSVSDSPEADAETLLAQADAALYRAKALGKRRAQFFDAELKAEEDGRDLLARELVGALDRGEMRQLYRPIVGLRDGAVLAVEGALRWAHPDRGILLAHEFAPLAQELGTIVAIDRWAIREACRHTARWNGRSEAAGGAFAGRAAQRAEPITTWVTVAPQDLLHGELAGTISGALEEHGVGPGALGIEVAMPAVARHPEDAERVLQSLAWLGVRVALDDFGYVGFTPLQLERFRVDTVKLDRRIVAALSSDPEVITAVAAMVGMSRELGIEVVAKGVETAQHLELLADLGCSHAQGPALALAQGEEEMTAMLASPPSWTDADGAAWAAAKGAGRHRPPRNSAEVVERMLALRGSDPRRTLP